MRQVIAVIGCLMGLFIAITPVSAGGVPYVIDGDLSDWGLKALATGSWNNAATWVPGGHATYVVEDNHNPMHNVLPAGVHIKGTGSTYQVYDEPWMTHKDGYLVSEPYGTSGGEAYDVEAIYFDQDDSTIYVAIVTSMPPDGVGEMKPGDLAIDLDGDLSTGEYGAEFGVKLGTLGYGIKQGSIVRDPAWDGRDEFVPEVPGTIVSSRTKAEDAASIVGMATVAYNNQWLTVKDNGRPNYVIECAIPKESLGVDSDVPFSAIAYNDNCLNAEIYVPEFPTIAVSFATLSGLAFVVYAVRQRKE